MEAIRQKMAGAAERRAVVRGARVIGAAMVERTPVQIERNEGSTALEPGAVKAGIKVRARKEDGHAVALVGPTGRAGAVGKVAHNVEYGHRMVVGGKSKLNIAGQFVGEGKVVGEVQAHAFLRPAFEASATGALEAMAQSYADDLKGAE